MDAFSVALSLGTLSISQKKCLHLSLCVGAFHFFMPIIGSIIGTVFVRNLHVESHFLSGIIFLYIAIEMIKDFKNDENTEFDLSIVGILLFALGVSLDSFGVGFTISLDVDTIIRCSLTFATFSAVITYIGLTLGKKLKSWVGNYSILIGAVIMVILSIINFCKFLV